MLDVGGEGVVKSERGQDDDDDNDDDDDEGKVKVLVLSKGGVEGVDEEEDFDVGSFNVKGGRGRC